MPSPEARSTDEMLTVVTRRAAYRMGRRARHRRILKLASIAILVMVAGAAVYVRADTGSRGKFNTVGMSISDSGADQPALTSAKGGPTATGQGAGSSASSSAERQVVSTGSITVRVHDVEQGAVRAAAIAKDLGGYVTSSETQLDGDRKVSVTLRVPADDFEKAMAQVARLGTVQTSSTDKQDVTDQVTDLEGRLKTARISADRLRDLLVDAQVLQNIITINDRLAALETQIEQLSGELKAVKDQVAYATIEVHLTEHAAPTVSDDLPGPLSALRSGAVAFVNVLIGVVAALAFALPFLLVALLGWWLVRRWRRRGLA